MSILYKRRLFSASSNWYGMALLDRRGSASANLVGLYNFLIVRWKKHEHEHEQVGQVTEEFLKEIIRHKLNECIRETRDISAFTIRVMGSILRSFRTEFCLQPRLSGPTEFVRDASYILCLVLQLNVLHGWVVSPDSINYESVKDFSHSELLEYCHELEGQDEGSDDLAACKSLLHDSKNQLTSHGHRAIFNELNANGLALLYCRSRLDLIFKHGEALFIYVTDLDTCVNMPDATWMAFEDCQDRNIYFTDMFLPVKGQPFEEKAKEFYKMFIANRVGPNAERNRRRKLKEKAKKQSQKGQVDPDAMASHQSEYEDDTVRAPEDDDAVAAVVQAEHDAVRSSDDNKAAEALVANLVEHKDASGSPTEESKSAETGLSHHTNRLDSIGNSPEDEDKIAAVVEAEHDAARSSDDDKAAEALVANLVEHKDASGSPTEESKSAETVASHHTNRLDSIGNSPEGDEGTSKGVDASLGEVPEGVASDFLKFLINFKGDGCSKTYFEGIVAAFPSHQPKFYVPYDFIMAYDEDLALNIQDNHSGIYEDLKHGVAYYLSKNKVHCPGVILEIIGLPEPKSVQCFPDFCKSINLHELYEVSDENAAALPSYDGRRMCLGYVHCIVAKFRMGKCWSGEWSESNLKVKSKGSEFVIECEKNYDLTPDRGYLDLRKFCTIVLELFDFAGQLPPFFDEFSDDIMLINDCFGDPVKWERFLQLISSPLAFKAPLVQSSFLYNIHLSANANSSGSPPRYSPLFSMKDCLNWRLAATSHPLLNKIYEYGSVNSTKMSYLMDMWAVSHWHVFKFSRHCIQHVLDYTKGNDSVQKVKDISVISVLLARTICKPIARSVRFLVLNCGVDGIFSSTWRHFAGSDYSDNPNALKKATNDLMKELVDSVSHCKLQRTGFVCSEVTVYAEPEHVTVLFGDTELAKLESELKNNNFKCKMDGNGCIQCGSIVLSNRIYSGTEKTRGHSAIVVRGPYSVEYDALFNFLVHWLGL